MSNSSKNRYFKVKKDFWSPKAVRWFAKGSLCCAYKYHEEQHIALDIWIKQGLVDEVNYV